ncbi:MAG TPA: LarC family nickel insertion protein, partial [Gaiellaceae bacterium]|nr:LarC family nickel insertion protein [Gaiellaceae bacterium]
MSRVAYLDCVGGLAGDMLLAALLDAGADPERLRAVPGLLGLHGVEIAVERVERQGIGALHVRVDAPGDHDHRHYGEIRHVVEAGDLPERVRGRSLDAFGRLAEVEGRIHGVPVEEVHFHELGGIDTLVDVCGTFVLIDDLEVERVTCSPLPFSRGLTRAAHGVLPLPAPATLALLEGAPLVGVETEAELVTPTGAAIAATAVDEWGPLPPLVLERVGYGAGTADFADRPNVVRVVLGREVTGSDPAGLTPSG